MSQPTAYEVAQKTGFLGGVGRGRHRLAMDMGGKADKKADVPAKPAVKKKPSVKKTPFTSKLGSQHAGAFKKMQFGRRKFGK